MRKQGKVDIKVSQQKIQSRNYLVLEIDTKKADSKSLLSPIMKLDWETIRPFIEFLVL
jgi:hypothetical protein